MKTLLAIDGGGLFGVGVANWIPKLENHEFDYYAGTSVGSILAACYAIGMSPAEVREKFNSDLPKRIFTKFESDKKTQDEAFKIFNDLLNPVIRDNKEANGIIDLIIQLLKKILRPAIYDNKEAEIVFEEIFKDIRVKDTKSKLTIVAWNYEKRKEKVFTHEYNGDYLLRDAVLASMSAPTYFPVAILKNEKGEEEKLGDGGVCGNDPSLAGISAMRDDGIATKDIKCLSISTTGAPKAKELDISSKLDWLPVITDIITLGNVGYTSYGVKHLLPNENYLRVEPEDLPSGSMDNFELIPDIKRVWENYDCSKALAFLKDTGN